MARKQSDATKLRRVRKELADAHNRAESVKMATFKVLAAGTQLANVAYNVSGFDCTADADADTMRACVESWDKAIRELHRKMFEP